MRIILLYILLALLGQQATFLETENLKTSESEKGLRANDKGLKANDKGLKSESRKVAK
ncbi:MAG: hypothetical protein J6Q59_08915 [Paludibacteraceae bacterium]|nr:hypothetical protein [Paludibacteraceae bacterium]